MNSRRTNNPARTGAGLLQQVASSTSCQTAVAVRRRSAIVLWHGCLVEFEFLQLIARRVVIGLGAEINERAQLRPGEIHKVGISPPPLRPFPRPRGLYVLFELKHDFAPEGLAEVEPAGKRHIRLHS